MVPQGGGVGYQRIYHNTLCLCVGEEEVGLPEACGGSVSHAHLAASDRSAAECEGGGARRPAQGVLHRQQCQLEAQV